MDSTEVFDKIKLLTGGTCNTYLIDDEEKILIDAGVNYEGKIDKILLTHGHEKHIKYLKQIIERNPKAEIYVSIKELPLLMKQGFEINDQFKALYEGKTKINTGKYTLEVIEVPAHTKGSVAFWDEKNKVLFTGDTLLKEGAGRTDHPESIPDFMDTAITLLQGLDSEIILPGHGEPFKIEPEIPDKKK